MGGRTRPRTWPSTTAPCTCARRSAARSYDLGSFVGQPVQADLDKGRLDITATDLAIASWGPPAALTRTYFSTRLSSTCFAPGWRFSFQRSLALGALEPHKVGYLDEAGCSLHVRLAERDFDLAGAQRHGGHPGPERQHLDVHLPRQELCSTFDASVTPARAQERERRQRQHGDLQLDGQQHDRRSRPPTASRSTSPTRAAKLASATYATAAGTREVDYSTPPPWTVTYLPQHLAEPRGQVRLHRASRLTEIEALDYPASWHERRRGIRLQQLHPLPGECLLPQLRRQQRTPTRGLRSATARAQQTTPPSPATAA